MDLLDSKSLGADNIKELEAIIRGNFNNKSEWLNALKLGIETGDEYRKFLEFQKVSSIIQKFKSSVPVQLTRITELANIEKKRVEQILLEISDSNTLGEFLPLEEVFIRSITSITEETSIPTDINCIVCRKPIYSKENYAVCPHCDGSAHIPELLEWLKTKTICPKCRKPLQETDFIIFNAKKSK